MPNYPPKEDYIQRLIEDIDDAAGDSYKAGDRLEELKKEVVNAEASYKYLLEQEASKRQLYFYLTGEEYWA